MFVYTYVTCIYNITIIISIIINYYYHNTCILLYSMNVHVQWLKGVMYIHPHSTKTLVC
jgi:hypothetical protein